MMPAATSDPSSGARTDDAKDQPMQHATGNGKLVIVTPCRDEETHLETSIRCMVEQTRRPDLWVIVDDGSTDRTPEILRDAAAQHDWIRVLTRADRGRRKVGPGVIEAFNAGLETVELDEFTYCCKLDADIEVPPRYFELALAEFERDPLLGNFSGKVYLREPDGRMIAERTGPENAIGQAKLYRVRCFREIGGFYPEVCWDGIDGHMCRLKGWVARSEDHPEMRIVHRRLMGSSEVGIWRGRRRWGFGKWFMGSSPLYVLAVSTYRMIERPFVIGGVGILWGYIGSALSGKARFPDPAFRRHLRNYEFESLIRGKARTAERYHDEIRAHVAARRSEGTS